MRRLMLMAALVMIPIGLFAARLTLRDGTVVTGRFISGSTGSIVFQDDGGIRRSFALDQVSAIDFNPVDVPISTYDSGRTSDDRRAADQRANDQRVADQRAADQHAAEQRAYADRTQHNAELLNADRTSGQVVYDQYGQRIDQNSSYRADQPAYQRPIWATLQPGTDISVRTDEDINSQNAAEGRRYRASIQQDILDNAGNVVIPRGSEASLVIRNMRQGGTFSNGDLILDLQSLTVGGRQYAVTAGDLQERDRNGIGKNTRTAEMVGGGAILGTLLGAIAGGGKGAGIGAIAGAIAGGGVEVLTKGRDIRVPAETVLHFRLEQPLQLREM